MKKAWYNHFKKRLTSLHSFVKLCKGVIFIIFLKDLLGKYVFAVVRKAGFI